MIVTTDNVKEEETITLLIEIGEIQYRINEEEDGGLRIVKTTPERKEFRRGKKLQITPEMNNSITIK